MCAEWPRRGLQARRLEWPAGADAAAIATQWTVEGGYGSNPDVSGSRSE
jgi:hypothetical protein